MRTRVIVLCSILFLSNISTAQASHKHSRPPVGPVRLPGAAFTAMQKIDPERIRAHVRFLSHDLLEGRGTGQRGGDIAAEFIATEFALYGLAGGRQRQLLTESSDGRHHAGTGNHVLISLIEGRNYRSETARPICGV